MPVQGCTLLWKEAVVVNFISENLVAGVDGTVVVLVSDFFASVDTEALRSFQTSGNVQPPSH